MTADLITTRAQQYGAQVGRLFRKFWVAVTLVAVGVGSAATITALHGDALSPIDEWVYVDYLQKLPAQGIVLKGEPIGEEALEIMACDGVTPYGPMGPPCGGDYSNLEKFPFGGITSADQYTPIYFAVTRLVGDVIHVVTGVDQLTGWRLTGSLWLAGALIALTMLLSLWKVRPIAQLALGLAFIGSPFAYWTYTYVSTDAPAFLLGAVLLIAAVQFSRGRTSGWWLVLIGAVASLIKITNLLGVGLVVLMLLLEVLMRRRHGVSSFPGPPSALRISAFALGTAVAAIVAQGAWIVVNSMTAVSGMRAEQGVSRTLKIDDLLSQVTNFLPGTIVSNVNIAGSTGYALPIPGYATAPLSWLCIAGVLGAFFMLSRRSERAPVVIAVVVASALFAPLLAIALQLVTSSYFTLPPRYGATLLPGFLLLAGLILRNRWASALIVTYSIAMCGVLIVGAALLGPHFSG